jgi:hypothetical protein
MIRCFAHPLLSCSLQSRLSAFPYDEDALGVTRIARALSRKLLGAGRHISFVLSGVWVLFLVLVFKLRTHVRVDGADLVEHRHFWATLPNEGGFRFRATLCSEGFWCGGIRSGRERVRRWWSSADEMRRKKMHFERSNIRPDLSHGDAKPTLRSPISLDLSALG